MEQGKPACNAIRFGRMLYFCIDENAIPHKITHSVSATYRHEMCGASTVCPDCHAEECLPYPDVRVRRRYHPLRKAPDCLYLQAAQV